MSWHVREDPGGGWLIVRGDTGEVVCRVEREEEARLIGSAPALFAACVTARECRYFAGYELECYVHHSGMLAALDGALR